MKNKQEILGQYFTKIEIVQNLVDLVLKHQQYKNSIKILEPSFGTGNFIRALKEKGFSNIDGCEIDGELTKNPSDFFNLSLDKKYDLIIGNPPFSKYNLKESYFNIKKHLEHDILSLNYLTKNELKKEK
ncbi:class I SAM-dependent methyltransferase, partial [Patescibacteria group bacterium]|nr:class I SAM-dependent methyltransferase [Patescibacteria group bacterium]